MFQDQAKKELTKSELEARKCQVLLGLRSRIEFIEGKYLWPDNVRKPNTRREKWMELLTSENKNFTRSTRIMELRKRVFEQYKISAASFVNNVCILYGEFSDNAAHKIKLPRNITESMVDEVYDLISIPEYQDLRQTIEIILAPFKSIEPPDHE